MSRPPAYSSNRLLCAMASDDGALLKPSLKRAVSEDQRMLSPQAGRVVIQNRDELEDIAGDAPGRPEAGIA
jgi:small ligand-binding sensory domain FIST